MIEHKFCQMEPEGIWVSELFPAASIREITQGVIAGFLTGHARWAIDANGVFLYGLDGRGLPMTKAPTARSRSTARSTRTRSRP